MNLPYPYPRLVLSLHRKPDSSANSRLEVPARSLKHPGSSAQNKSGWRESNSHPKLGKLMCYHYTTAAKSLNHKRSAVYSALSVIAIDPIQLH